MWMHRWLNEVHWQISQRTHQHYYSPERTKPKHFVPVEYRAAGSPQHANVLLVVLMNNQVP